MKESRLVSFDGQKVTFVKSRRHEPYEELTVPVDEFIRRILRHVPPLRFRTVRGYGLYAPSKGEERREAQRLLGHKPETTASSLPSQSTRSPQDFCPHCGQDLIVVEVIPRPVKGQRAKSSRAPPLISGGLAV